MVRIRTLAKPPGRFKLEGVDSFSANKISKILEIGDVEVIPSGTPHRLVALADGSEICEVSTATRIFSLSGGCVRCPQGRDRAVCSVHAVTDTF